MKLLDMKMSKKKFVILALTAIGALLLSPKDVLAKIFLRKTNGQMIDIDDISSLVSSTVNYLGGYISSIDKADGTTITFTNTDGYIDTVTNGTKTITFTRNGDNQITGWSVS